MPSVKTPKRYFAEELIRDNPGKSDHWYATKLYEGKFGKDFNSFIHARNTVLQIRGHHGQKERNCLKDKSLMAPLQYSRINIDNQTSKEYRSATKRKLNKSKYYIITWAQNNTSVHQPLWDNIMAYAKHLNASIHVVLGRYKNPTRPMDNDEEEHWDSQITPYADAKRHNIHKNLQLLSDIKIQPTATNPLTGMEGMSGLKSAIFGHPKMQMDTIPALEGYEAKLMFTTGSVTKVNYSDSKAGKKGAFHHSYGFVIVEIKNENVFIPRQVTACNDGSFSDLIYNVSNGRVKRIETIDYMNLGDKHIGEHCPVVEKQQRKILSRLKPKHTIIQDIYNGHSVNPHEEFDPIKKYLLQAAGKNLIKREIAEMMAWIRSMIQYNLVIVPSNHNDWLDRYINKQDWKKDIANAMEYAEYSKILLSNQAPKGLIAHLIDKEFGKRVKTLSRNDSFRVNGIELAQHGDKGANGSKGSIQQFKRLSTKIDVGHSHTPKRIDGVMYVGTSSILRVGYTVGASSWYNCDIICHKDGKRQQIFYMGPKKEFTTFVL
jgi:hypothetical protein